MHLCNDQSFAAVRISYQQLCISVEEETTSGSSQDAIARSVPYYRNI
jgi:hypothetical protein